MLSTIPPFELSRSISTRCIKCGSENLYTKFYKKGDYVSGERPFDGECLFKSDASNVLIDETLVRLCINCRYKWLERPLDYVEGKYT